MLTSIVALVVKEIVLPSNETIGLDETILIDPVNMVGLWNNTHFDVFPDEYIILN